LCVILNLRLFLQISAISAESTPAKVLKFPWITKWGTWGKALRCTRLLFVNGMKLKIQGPQEPTVDDTGVNGMRVYCTPVPVSLSQI